MSRISKLMKGQGFTKTFPSIYIQSMIKSIFGHGVYKFYTRVISQKTKQKKKQQQKTKNKKQQKLTLSSKRGNLQSSILFILSTAAPIIMQTGVL